jgi:hypothetical protein
VRRGDSPLLLHPLPRAARRTLAAFSPQTVLQGVEVVPPILGQQQAFRVPLCDDFLSGLTACSCRRTMRALMCGSWIVFAIATGRGRKGLSSSDGNGRSAASCRLTGRRDFPPGRDPWSIVLEVPAIPIRQRKSWLPPRLAEVIDRTLVEGPEIPFNWAAALRKALEEMSSIEVDLVVDRPPDRQGDKDVYEVLPSGGPQGVLFLPAGADADGVLLVEARLVVIRHPVHQSAAFPGEECRRRDG